MNEQAESSGRIEVAPDVLATIAYFATLKVEGVAKMASVPSDAVRLFRRYTRRDGIILDLADDKIKFDIYVIMEPDVNIMEKSRVLQTAVVEAIDTMVGLPVEAVNIHVEDVVYVQTATG
jgi:uncharacterized alkaline shock family protein YloU